MSTTFGYREGLTHLRGLAVTLVVLFHAGVVDSGYVGVDVFFVLSGFLIANILWSDANRDQSAGTLLAQFYARRLRRLLPLSLLVLLMSAVAARLWFMTLAEDWGAAGRAAVLWFENWYLIGQANDYFAPEGTNPFQHYWSLGIEEQFYVVLPLLLLAIAALTRSWSEDRRLVAVAGTAALLIVVALGSAWLTNQPTSEFYFSTLTRSYQLMAGVAAMAVARRFRIEGTSRAGALVGTIGIVIVGGVLDLPVVLAGLAATVFAVACVLASRVILLSWPPLEWLGNWSYGIYLWHYIINEYLSNERLGWSPWAIFSVTMVSATALAAITYRFFESPIRRSNVRPTTTFIASGLALAGSWFAVGAIADSAPAAPANEAENPSGTLSLEPSEQRVATADLILLPDTVELDHTAIGQCGHADRTTSCVDLDARPLVLLIGDSFANQIYQGVRGAAEDNGWGLAAFTRPGCPWMLDVYTRVGGAFAEDCAADKPIFEEVYDFLQPDVVVVHAYPYVDSEPLTSVSTEQRLTPADVTQAVNDSLDWFTSRGADVVMFGSTPIPDEASGSVIDCLKVAEWADECAFSPLTGGMTMDDAMQARAAADERVSYVPMMERFCPDKCPPNAGNVRLYEDNSHVAGGVWYELRDEIAEPLRAAIERSG